MTKLERWIVASRKVKVFDDETRAELDALGVSPGGGWDEVHRHLHVTPENKEKVEELLRAKGYTVAGPSDPCVEHPDMHEPHHRE